MEGLAEDSTIKNKYGMLFFEHGRWYAGPDAEVKVPVSSEMAAKIRFVLNLDAALLNGLDEGGRKDELPRLLARLHEYNCHRTAFHLMGYVITDRDASGWCQDMVRRHIDVLDKTSGWTRCTQTELPERLGAYEFPCIVHIVNRKSPTHILPEHSFVVLGRSENGAYVCIAKYGLEDSPITIATLNDEMIDAGPDDHFECYILPAGHVAITNASLATA